MPRELGGHSLLKFPPPTSCVQLGTPLRKPNTSSWGWGDWGTPLLPEHCAWVPPPTHTLTGPFDGSLLYWDRWAIAWRRQEGRRGGVGGRGGRSKKGFRLPTSLSLSFPRLHPQLAKLQQLLSL